MRGKLDTTLKLAKQNGSIMIDTTNRVIVQDEFAGASVADIREAYRSLDANERRNFLFVAQASLSTDEAVRVWRMSYIQDIIDAQLDKLEDELQGRFEEVAKRENDVLLRLDGLAKVYDDLKAEQDRTADLTRRLADAQERINHLLARVEVAEANEYSAKLELRQVTSAIETIGKHLNAAK